MSKKWVLVSADTHYVILTGIDAALVILSPAFLSGLSDEEWAQEGSNLGSPVSLLEKGTWLTNHDTGHVAQIQRSLPARAQILFTRPATSAN